MPIRRYSKRRKKTVYNPSFRLADGRWVEKRLGITNLREAKAREAEFKLQIEQGTYGEAVASTMTVREWYEQWFKTRTNKTKGKDAQHMRDYVLPEHGEKRLCDLRKKDPIALVRKLLANGTDPKTTSNIWGTYCRCLRDAEIEELVPWTASMPRGVIPKKQPPIMEIYSNADVTALIRGGKRSDMRLLALITFFTAMREGEVCGLRWRDWQDVVPGDPDGLLGSFAVQRQYDGRGENAQTKTKAARMVPVHPLVAAALRVTLSERPRGRDEPIIERLPGIFHTRNSAYAAWARHTRYCNVRPFGLHRIRHTATTAMRRGGAHEHDVKMVTHNPRRTIVDRYTHDWSILCRVIYGIDYKTSEDTLVPLLVRSGSNDEKPLEIMEKKERRRGVSFPAPFQRPYHSPVEPQVLQPNALDRAHSRSRNQNTTGTDAFPSRYRAVSAPCANGSP